MSSPACRGRVHLHPRHCRRREVRHDRCPVLSGSGPRDRVGTEERNRTTRRRHRSRRVREHHADQSVTGEALDEPAQHPSGVRVGDAENADAAGLGGVDQRHAADFKRRMSKAVTGVDHNRRRPRDGHDGYRIADHLPARDVFAVGGQVREADRTDAVRLCVADAASRWRALRRTGTGGRQRAIAERLDFIQRQRGRGGVRQRRTASEHCIGSD